MSEDGLFSMDDLKKIWRARGYKKEKDDKLEKIILDHLDKEKAEYASHERDIYNWNVVKNFMWDGAVKGGQKPNPQRLREAAYDLIQMLIQKSDGHRGSKKATLAFDSELEMSIFTVALEAVVLVVSGQLDLIWFEYERRRSNEVPAVRTGICTSDSGPEVLL